jgi:hypothetical protein
LDWEEPEQSGYLKKLLLKNPFLMRWQIHGLRQLCFSFASVDCGDDGWHEILELLTEGHLEPRHGGAADCY